MATSGDVLAGKYRLERVLGSGGMGEIWLARHVELGSNVAVKLMSRALIPDATARARFRREARAAARLRSPHVVAVQDFGDDDGAPYLVMEFLEGQTLQEHAGNRPLAPIEAAELVDQAARGLGLAHARGVVHRDVKPSNLFLANVGGQPVLKIIDFGIARALMDEEDAKVTRSGAILGSPAFMSPEQASGEPVTPASDVWSLSAVTYWMITGKEPFSGRMMSETLHRIRTAQFTRPSELIPELPSAVDAFFAKAFRLDAGERYESAEHLAAAFRAAVVRSQEDPSSKALLDGMVWKRSHAGSAPRRWSRTSLLVLLVGSGLTTATVALLPLVRDDTEAPPAPGRTALAPTQAENADPGGKVVAVVPGAASAIESAPPAPKSNVMRRTTPRTARPEPSALTPEPALATPAPSGETIDPLFGIRVKRPPVGAAAASEGSGPDLGAAPR